MDAEVAGKLIMKLLVVSYAFPPWLSPRSIQSERLLNHLSKKAYQITVITSCPDQIGVPLDEGLLGMLNPKIRLIRIADPRHRLVEYIKNHYPSLQKMPDTANSWIPGAYRACMEIVSDYDLLLTYSTPVSDHVLGYLIKRKYPRLPWVAFFSDPYVVNPFIQLSRFEKKINEYLEKTIIAHADSIIFVNDHTRLKTMERYHPSYFNKAIVIPHAFDETLYQKNQGKNDRLMIRHLGDFYGSRTPEPLLEALSLLSEEKVGSLDRIVIEFYGKQNKAVEDIISRYGLEDVVRYKGQVDYLKSLQLMSTSDVLLVIDSPSGENLFLTSKVIDYLGADIPILAITPECGPTAELMHSIGHTPYTFDDPAGIARQISEYLDHKQARFTSSSIPGHIYARYRIDAIAREYCDLFEHLVSKSFPGVIRER